jgi:N-acetylglutamate synthase-like GNAT family acetyltransferase
MHLLSRICAVLCVALVFYVNASSTTFQDATEADLPSLNTLMRASKEKAGGDNYTKEYLDEFMKLLSVTPEVLEISKVKILFVDQTLAGFYSFYINEGKELELDNFFLDPKFLYQGYGKKLWAHCLATAQEYKREFSIL